MVTIKGIVVTLTTKEVEIECLEGTPEASIELMLREAAAKQEAETEVLIKIL